MSSQGGKQFGLALVAALTWAAGLLFGLHLLGQPLTPMLVALAVGGSVALVAVVFGLLRLGGRGAASDPLVGLAIELGDAADREAIGEIITRFLGRDHGLSPIYLTLRESGQGGGHPALRCIAATQAASVLPLPERFAPGEFEPIRRALASGDASAVDDVVARAAQAVGGKDGDRRSEALFWAHYGVRLVVPGAYDTGGDGDDETVCALILGGPPGSAILAASARARLAGLAHLAAAALSRVVQFERLEDARAGLEREADVQASRLRDTMGVLESAHAQLVEAEKQAMLGRLVAGIVHEINTPLGTIGSSVDTLTRAIDRYRPFVVEQAQREDAGKAGERALRAIDQQKSLVEVLERSRTRIGEVLGRLQRFVSLDAAEVKPLDLKTAIEDAIELVRPTMGDAIEIVKELPEEVVAIPCFPAKLNQVFLNLIQNAVDALEGRGTLTITMFTQQRAVRIVFADTGRGIAETKLDNVLDFGFTTKLGGRIGLRMGLPASNQAINELGGRLSIGSQVGEGTTVTVVLPLDSTPLKARARGAAASSAGEQS